MKTPTTHFIGTVGFAPPEQFSLRPVFASDIYALGITCIYLLTGKAPLDFDTDRQTGELLWQNSVPLSKSFAKILNKMLKISLQDRYKSAGAILQALDQESPQDNLEQCMITRYQPAQDGTQSQNDSDDYSHRTPAAKAALAIRDWKHRVQERQRQRQKEKIDRLLSELGKSL